MGGLQGWYWIMAANIVIVAGLIFLAYWFFVGSRKRQHRSQKNDSFKQPDQDL